MCCNIVPHVYICVFNMGMILHGTKSNNIIHIHQYMQMHGKIWYINYRIARNFRGLKFSWIGLPENFRDFIFADGRFDLMTY